MSTRANAAALSTLALAAVAWVAAVGRMRGMDMGAATALGSFAFFFGLWALMMAAMMLPGAIPAIARRAEDGLRSASLFAASYLGVWTLVGVAVYVSYRPHHAVAAGVLTVAAGLYELTPFKRDCRRRCRENVRSGARFGFYCVGSSAGLMLMLVGIGVMSVLWMAVVALLVLGQKLLPPRRAIDLPVALAIVGLGLTQI